MRNVSSFLGYSRLAAETTAFELDQREQIDLSTDNPLPSPSDPLYRNLFAPTQWPNDQLMPKFKKIYVDYIKQMGTLSMEFVTLIGEALGLGAGDEPGRGGAFERFFETEGQRHKLKIVKYPDLDELGIPEGLEGQGVGKFPDASGGDLSS
jgi:isopenicillin N synthase-like dioxygenase